MSALLVACKAKQTEKSSVDHTFKTLLFTKTEGYRHASIHHGIIAIKQLGKKNNFVVTHSEDASVFTTKNLLTYDVIIFLSTTGDILSDVQQSAMENFIRAGNGFVGIHAATDTEYKWPWYNGLVGAYFSNHPPGVHKANVTKTKHKHVSTEMLPNDWVRTDEWYNFKSVDGGINKILNLEESSYKGGDMGNDHPIAWYHEYDGGRSWYTAGGHTEESFSELLFVQHLEQGIIYASGK